MSPAQGEPHKSKTDNLDGGVSHGREFLCGYKREVLNADDEDELEEVEADDDTKDQTGEGIRVMRKATIPKKPNSSEVEDHRKSHLPYRNWCPWCVMGRGLGAVAEPLPRRSGGAVG